MPLQRVLPREGLPAAAVAEERLLARVRVAMALEVVLAVERQRAHVARERPRGRRGELRPRAPAARHLAVPAPAPAAAWGRAVVGVGGGCHAGHRRGRLRR